MRKLKRGIGKYKGKVPLICFNCGEISHFTFKCPHARSLDNNDEKEDHGKLKKNKRRYKKQGKMKGCKKGFYSKEDKSSSEEESDSVKKMT